jgi:DNA-directed RNA polymerase subunit RPC12/RpoP
MALNEYKCPNCGGAVSFDAGKQTMVCPYCDCTFDIEAMLAEGESPDASSGSIEWEMPEQQWQPGEQDGMGIYTCKSCAGEITADQNLGATQCPFCGNQIVMTGQFTGTLKPDLIIPFKLDKNKAIESLKKHYEGKKLLPKSFKNQNRLEEIQGTYIPFWLFNANVDASFAYDATKTKRWEDDNYRYEEVSHYLVKRSGKIAFDNIAEDGSSKAPDDMMESIEPFDVKDAVEFKTPYLAGYLASKYDMDAKKMEPRANERVTNSTDSEFRKTVTGYDSVKTKTSRIDIKEGEKVRYALFPVWLLSTMWNGTNYQFGMNAQTGKFVGNLPVDKAAIWKYLGRVFAIVAALAIVVLAISDSLEPGNIALGLLAGLVAGALYAFYLKSQLKSVAMQNYAADYIRQGSFVVNTKTDRFLYTTKNRTAKPKKEGK